MYDEKVRWLKGVAKAIDELGSRGVRELCNSELSHEQHQMLWWRLLDLAESVNHLDDAILSDLGEHAENCGYV